MATSSVKKTTKKKTAKTTKPAAKSAGAKKAAPKTAVSAGACKGKNNREISWKRVYRQSFDGASYRSS